MECHAARAIAALDFQMFEVRACARLNPLPPFVRRQIQIGGPYQVADFAALMRLFNARPGAVELAAHIFRLVNHHHGVLQQVKNAAVRARHGRIKLPAGKHAHAPGPHRLLNYFLRSGNAFPGKPGMNRAQNIFAHRRVGQRQQHSFIHRIGRSLRAGIELADRLHFVAEQLDAHRAVGLGRINIQNAAAQRIFAGHLDHIHGDITHRVEVGHERFGIDGLRLAQGSRQFRVILRRAQADGRRRNRRDHDGGRARGNLPQRGGAFFLKFRMGREILKRQHVARRKPDDGVGLGASAQLAERGQHRNQLFGSAIVGNNDDQRPGSGLLQQNQQQRLGGGGQSRHTYPPRALFQMGGYTREGGQVFHVRE